MTDLVAAAAFAGFVALAVLVAVMMTVRVAEPTRRRATSILIAYVLLVTAVAGLSRRDLWPFSSWQLMVGEAPAAIGRAPDPEVLRIVAVDDRGDEHLVDYRAWQPLSIEDMSRWLVLHFDELQPAERRRVADHLLAQANRGRERASTGRSPGSFDRWWGALSTPYHLLHPRRWNSRDAVPARPFVGVRLYREHYGLESAESARDMGLELLYDSSPQAR